MFLSNIKHLTSTDRLIHSSLRAKASNDGGNTSDGSFLKLQFFLKICQMVNVPSEGHITTYSYFFGEERIWPRKSSNI